MVLKGELYIVATPIGNPDDITLRALKILKEADLVVCEEKRTGSTLLKQYGIETPLEILNEHNEEEQTKNLFAKLLSEGLKIALISDAGTPLFADPGNILVEYCIDARIPVVPIPGPSSLMAALMVSGLKLERFLYYGFLHPNRQMRLRELKKLPSDYDLVLLETPYRLNQLLTDLQSVMGKSRNVILAYRLTFPEERIIRKNLGELIKKASSLPKGEFVLILPAQDQRSRK
ncbi:MAG: 16S rRNA (cytidine(1402)-2'-O)-methyltransferase [Candidatus Cloacimonetes bacterium]|nr:16S rRNA (cytidine(1402)-2'-O)-methyltransferase [Candidatus Cloacimonadota bacterium]